MGDQSESYIQSEIVKWFTNNHCLKTNFPRWLIFSVPNGGLRNKKEAVRLRSEGLLPGVSDLIVVYNYELLYIEVKTDGGTQSKEQKEFQSRVENLGFKYFVVHSLDEFKGILQTI